MSSFSFPTITEKSQENISHSESVTGNSCGSARATVLAVRHWISGESASLNEPEEHCAGTAAPERMGGVTRSHHLKWPGASHDDWALIARRHSASRPTRRAN